MKCYSGEFSMQIINVGDGGNLSPLFDQQIWVSSGDENDIFYEWK